MKPLPFAGTSLLVVLLLISKGYTQSLTKTLFLGKQDFKTYNIREIKELDDSQTDTAYYKFYRFNNKGQLILYADRGLFLSEDDALAGGNKYRYNTTGKLISYEGNGNLGEGHQSDFALFGYDDKKLIFVINGYEYNGRNNGGMDLTDVTIYDYSVEGKLISTINQLISKKGNLTMANLEELVSKTKSISQLRQAFIIDKKEILSRYFFYDQNKIIGYFPVEKKDIGINTSDTIYTQTKLTELKRIGFKMFGEKYFTETIKDKIITDCYQPIKSKNLIINNQPLNTFLSHTDKKLVNYIILEVADSDCLFYKLID